MNEAILDMKLKLWQDRLLDLGKRNKMISFRETRRSTLRLVSPGFEELYRQIVSDERELTFQKAIDRDTDARVYSVLSLLDRLSTPIEVAVGDIRAEGSLPETQKTLKNLRAKARLALDEQGTNILYLIFGFIEWREKGSRGDSRLKSPLLLVPVTLLLPSLNGQYSLKKQEDEVAVNPTLAYLFERDYGIKLPEFDPEKDSLGDFLQTIQSLVEDRGWNIVRECSIALVSFLKISMYNDLVRNETQLKTNPIIRAFAKEQNEASAPQQPTIFNHDDCKAADSYLVLDADSSQLDAVALSRQGISFVLQGPPGSGKSQTIANIIAQALADDKRILFVSEKMAALEVVYRRLSDVQLADFCLSLHSHKANKREILNQLGANLHLQQRKVSDREIAKLARLDIVKEQLRHYVQDIHATVSPLDMSLYEVYGAIAQRLSLPDIALTLPQIDTMTQDQMHRLALHVADFEKAQRALGTQWHLNPWQGINCAYLEPSHRKKLLQNLEAAIDAIDALEHCPVADQTLAQLLSLDNLDDFLKLYNQALLCSNAEPDWFTGNTQAKQQLLVLRQRKQDLQELQNLLTEKYSDGFFTFAAAQQLPQLCSAVHECREKLNHASSDDAAFQSLEEDRLQLDRLRIALISLQSEWKTICATFGLEHIDQFDHLHLGLKLCDMLAEQHPFTAGYFGAENLQRLQEDVSRFHQCRQQLFDCRQVLLENYSDILPKQSTRYLQQLDAAVTAMESICPVEQWDQADFLNFTTLKDDAIDQTEAAMHDEKLCATAAKYHFNIPNCWQQLDRQKSALDAMDAAPKVILWQTKVGRQQTRSLVESAMCYSRQMQESLSSVQDFFTQTGITLDAEALTEDTLSVLQHALSPSPIMLALAPICNDPQVDALLDRIEQNAQQVTILQQEIGAHRAAWHIAPSVTDTQLSGALHCYKAAQHHHSPVHRWATAFKDADALLHNLQSLSKNLCNQYVALTQQCEDSLFQLDYAGMLYRFKTNYTGILKHFHRSYSEDLRRIRLVYRDVEKKLSDEEIVELLQSLRQYQNDLTQYQSYRSEVAKYFGIDSYDMHYPWQSIRDELDAFSSLIPLFETGKAAADFASSPALDTLIGLLAQHNLLHLWFEQDTIATPLLGDFYLGCNTDTATLRTVLQQVRQQRSLFQTRDEYLRFLQTHHTTQAAAVGLQLAKQFLTQQTAIDNLCCKLRQLIDTDCNIHTLSIIAEQLDAYDEFVRTFSRQALTAFLQGHNFATYRDGLQAVLAKEPIIKTVYHCSCLSRALAETDFATLLANMRVLCDSAADVLSVYRFTESYQKENVASRCIAQLKQDLISSLSYHAAQVQYNAMDAQLREHLGSAYCGENTNWDIISGNILVAQQLHALLEDLIPEQLISAFVSGTVVYSKNALAQLWHRFTTAQEIDRQYHTIASIPDFGGKLEVIQAILPTLETACRTKQELLCHAYNTTSYRQICDDLRSLAALQKAQLVYAEEVFYTQQTMPNMPLSTDTDWDEALRIFDHIAQLKQDLEHADPKLHGWLTGATQHSVRDYEPMVQNLCRNQSCLTELFQLFSHKQDLMCQNLVQIGAWLRDCHSQFDTLDLWIDLRDCRKCCEENGLGDFLTGLDQVYYPTGSAQDVFYKSFYYAWFEAIATKLPSVSSFRTRTQESRVQSFRELDAHQLPVDQMRIREKLIRAMPTELNATRATDEMSILLHELSKKRNLMPLRKLFRTIPNLLLRLKPCLMMSPLSVAHFLEAETYRFDMVIFDEASQIFPQDAIGAIFRGKQVIIAGDSKQLPPTSFFIANTDNPTEYDPDDEDGEGFVYDSILEEAAGCLLNRSLLWHYRSRYEELIAFSNREIYNSNLITFPSSTTHSPDTGVEYVYVPDGVFENRCNRREAEWIVELIIDHIQNHPDRSLGVIAFSENQQNTIEEALHQYRTGHPEYEDFFDENKDEPFFIKNLENVQGDERDTILFSIGYGKNARGKMYMRFGPLGQIGGERRLNVAITRAKQNVKLVGSIQPEDIDLENTNAEGVRMLRSYIQFAIHGSSVLSKHTQRNRLYDVDTFSQQVAQFLIQQGYAVRTNVGNSDYTIDIAVEHPKQPGHYIAGIECDGSSYVAARTVRDRERLRTNILEQMGWKMHRVWSTEWIRNPATEQERLIQFLQDALLSYGDERIMPSHIALEVDTEVVAAAQVQSDSDNPYGFPCYEEGKWWDYGTRRGYDNESHIADMIAAVVRVEQPMHMELMYKRVGVGFTAGRATQVVRSYIDEIIQTKMQGEVVIEDQFIRMADLQTVTARRSPMGEPQRNIEHISIPEIAAAMERILRGAYGMERSVLCLVTANIFGFERVGPKLRQRTNDTVDYLLRQGKISVIDDKIQLLEG